MGLGVERLGVQRLRGRLLLGLRLPVWELRLMLMRVGQRVEKRRRGCELIETRWGCFLQWCLVEIGGDVGRQLCDWVYVEVPVKVLEEAEEVGGL